MARETKIGLVVGMGFIICFAIILSHRGQPVIDPDKLPFKLADAADDPAANIRSNTAEQAARDIGRRDELARNNRSEAPPHSNPAIPANRIRNRPDAAPRGLGARDRGRTNPPSTANLIAPRPDPLAQAESNPNRFATRGEPITVGPPESLANRTPAQNPDLPDPATDRQEPQGEPLVIHLPPTADAPPQDARPAKTATLSAQLRTSNDVLDAVAAGGIPSTAEGHDAENTTAHLLQSKPADTWAPSTDALAITENRSMLPPAADRNPTLRSTPVDAPKSQKQNQPEYTIQPGDMLSRIAKQHYGTAGPAILDAICKANPKTLPDPNRIVVGRTIVLPDLGIQAPKAEPSPEVVEPRPVRPAVAAPVDSGKRYKIQSGDTLGKIAKTFYGVSAAKVVDAICAANPRAITDPNVVVVGREIVLPDIDGVGAPKTEPGERLSAAEAQPQPEAATQTTHRDAPAPTKPKDRRVRESDKRDFKWYQLKKGDHYSTVAAEVLGSSKRWREIAELNKDIFPDPAKIRSGVNIRIPTAPAQLSARTNGGI